MTKSLYIMGKGWVKERPVPPPTGLHSIVPDIKPYRSMIDGSTIGGRSAHREHLRQNGAIEVGNEKVGSPMTRPIEIDRAELRKDIRKAMQERR